MSTWCLHVFVVILAHFLARFLRLLLARDETERGDARDEEVAAATQRREARV
jgi:hypothetical protein